MHKDMESSQLVVLDIETTGLDRFKDRINMVGFSTQKNQYVILKEHIYKYLTLTKPILAKTKVGMHWGKFDSLFLYTKYGILIKPDLDLSILTYIYDHRLRLGLYEIAMEFLGVEPWDIGLDDKTQISPLSIKYCKKDCKYTHQAIRKIWNLMGKRQRKLVLKLMMPVYQTYIDVETRGIQLEETALGRLSKYFNDRKDTLEKQLHKYKEINWGSTKQVGIYLYDELKLPVLERTKTKNPSTNKTALNKMMSMHPCISILKEYREVRQVLSLSLNKWNDLIQGGKLYPHFDIVKTTTGRTVCTEPNIQQVPRNKKVRGLFTSSHPNYVLVEADYSQVELRIIADRANEPVMIKAYTSGQGDLHKITGQKLAGRKKITSEERSRAKPVNFGFCYDMWEESLKPYALNNYGVVLTIAQCKQFYRKYFETYSRLKPWHRLEKLRASENGYVENAIGRRRILDDIHHYSKWIREKEERRAVNMPIQSLASDILISVMAEINAKIPTKYVRIVGTIHDSVLMEVRKSQLNKILTKVKNIMEHPQLFKDFEVKLKVPLVADFEVGDWGSGEEWLPSAS